MTLLKEVALGVSFAVSQDPHHSQCVLSPLFVDRDVHSQLLLQSPAAIPLFHHHGL